MKTLIKHGRLIDPANKTDALLDILIEDGKIKELSVSIETKNDLEIIDARGLVICPGFIDMHVHLREPGQEHKETIASGIEAAAHGGFTSIACMPNTSPVIDHPELVEYIVSRAKDIGRVNVFPIAAVTKNLAGEEPTNMFALVKAGAVGFSDDGRCVMNAGLLRKALENARELDVPIIEHPEDHNLSGAGQVNEGAVSAKCGLAGIPAAAEEAIVARDILLQQEIASRLHLTHISTAGSAGLIRAAKEKKINVTADVTPHHLLLNEELIAGKNPVYKVKPPLRTETDRLAMVKSIQTGIFDCIASDHAPHAREEKEQDFAQAPFGLIGMETSFPVIYDRLVKSKIISLDKSIALFSTNPARILNLKDRGRVQPGLPADLTILDLDERFTITRDYFLSRSNNCPFIGWQGLGVIAYTIVSGKVVYSRRSLGK